MIKLQNCITKVLDSQVFKQIHNESLPAETNNGYTNNNLRIVRRFAGQCAIKKDAPLDCSPIKDLIEDRVTFFSRNTSLSHRRLLDYLIDLKSRHFHIYPSRKTIGLVIGLSVSQVGRLLADLKSWGLIITEKRFKLSSHYHLSSYLFLSEVMQSLGHFIKAFRILSLTLLSSSLFSSDAPQFSKRLNRYLKNPFLLSFNHSKSDQLTEMGKVTKKNKNESSMNAQKKNIVPIHPVVNAIKNIREKYKLTITDQIRLAAYPTTAIEEADEAFDNARAVNDSVGFIFSMCKKYCDRERLNPDWSYTYALAEAYKIDLKVKDKPIAISKSELIKEKRVVITGNQFKPDYENDDDQPEYSERKPSAYAPRFREKGSFIKKEEGKKAVEEWKGHTQPPKQEKTQDNISDIIMGLNKKTPLMMQIINSYPQGAKDLLIQQFGQREECKCGLLKDNFKWEFECEHEKKASIAPVIDQDEKNMHGLLKPIIEGSVRALEFLDFIDNDVKIKLREMISEFPQYDTPEIRSALST